MSRFLDFFIDRKARQDAVIQPQTAEYWPLDLPLIRFSEQRADSWTLADACQGVLIMGENGSGKTSGSGQILARKYLQSGFGGLVLCYKTDEADLWRKYLTETGRSHDALFFSAEGDLRFNFLDYEARCANLEIPRGDVQRNQRMCPQTGRKKKGYQINKQLEKTRSNQVLQRRFRSRRLRRGLNVGFFPFGVVRPVRSILLFPLSR